MSSLNQFVGPLLFSASLVTTLRYSKKEVAAKKASTKASLSTGGKKSDDQQQQHPPCEIHGRLLPGVSISAIKLYDILNLRDNFPSADILNNCGPGYNKIISGEDFVVNDIVRKSNSVGEAEAFVRAGPRSFTHFDPAHVRAAIVTCGGLCPGLNHVNRERFHSLKYLYKVNDIYAK